MAIPEYPTLPSQENAPQASRSRLGRTVVGATWFVALLVLSFLGVVVVPGALIVFVLMVGDAQWLYALLALAALVVWATLVRFVGQRMTRVGVSGDRAIRWDEHFE